MQCRPALRRRAVAAPLSRGESIGAATERRGYSGELIGAIRRLPDRGYSCLVCEDHLVRK
jgi:hypothetical protein